MNHKQRMQPLFTATLMVAGALALAGTLNAASRSTSYTYYNTAPKQGLLQSIDGPRTDVADITTLDYDNQGNLTLVTNALGHSSQIIAHDPSGRPLEIVSSNALHTTFQYDVRGHLKQITRFPTGDLPANGRTTTFSYTPAGDINTIALPAGEILSYTYDDARRLTRVTDNQGQYIVYVLDPMGNVLSETIHASDTSLVRQQSAVYNQLGQLFQSIGAENQTTEYGYDLNGNSTDLLDARSNPTTQAFDALNRLVGVLDAKSGITQYGYDSAGNLNSVIDPKGNTTSYTYDGLDNLTVMNSPDTGLTTYDTYDDAGNLLQETNANGITINYSYDALNRLTQIQYPDSSQNITYHYDGNNYTTADADNDQPQLTQYPIGQRTGMTDATGTTAWFYSAYGELIQTRKTLPSGQTFITAHRYDAQTGLLSTTTYPGSRELQYHYDAQGQIIQIDTTYQGQPQSLIANVQYQPFGEVKSYEYGNGLSLNRSFDQDGRLASQTVTGTSTILNLSWNYNPVSSVETLNNLLDATLNQSFVYDELDRLSSAQTNINAYGVLSFSYDANGNRTLEDDNNQITDYLINSTSNRTDSVTGAKAETIQHDARGNIIQRIINSDVFEYHYNQQNRLVGIDKNQQRIATYQYNGLGQRVSKTLANGALTDYLYTPQGQLMAEVDGSGRIIWEYLYFNQAPLAKLSTSRFSLYCVFPEAVSQPVDPSAQGRAKRATQRNAGREPGAEPQVIDCADLTVRLDNFITENYLLILQRSPSALELNDWSATLLDDAMRGDGLIRSLFNSQEFSNQSVDDTTFVSLIYQVLFNTLPEPEVESELLTQLAFDSTRMQVLNGLMQSIDFDSILNRYGLSIYAPDGTVANEARIYYYHNDHLGTPQVMTDDAQAVVWEGQYSPFGAVTTSVESVENNLRFAGQYFDVESGLHYNYHRYYDPSLGRYITSDPIGLDGGLNTYGYVGGNPINWVDPFGLISAKDLRKLIGRVDSAQVHCTVAMSKAIRGGDWGTAKFWIEQCFPELPQSKVKKIVTAQRNFILK